MDILFAGIGIALLIAAFLGRQVKLAGNEIPAPETPRARAAAGFLGLAFIVVALLIADVIALPDGGERSPAAPSSSGAAASAEDGSARVLVANVYNLPRARGLAMVADQGFANVKMIEVCSNSVAAGRIREVLLDNQANVVDETVLVGPAGPTVEVPLSTKLLVKISNGPCP